MVVNSLIFVGVKQVEGFLDLVFLILGQLSSLLALVFVCRKFSPAGKNVPIKRTVYKSNLL